MSLAVNNYGINRREHPRAPIRSKAKFANDASTSPIEIVQISEGGLCIRTCKRPAIGTHFFITLAFSDYKEESVTVEVKRHILDKEGKITGIGCQWVKAGIKLREAIRSHVEKTKNLYKNLIFQLSLNNLAQNKLHSTISQLGLSHITDRTFLKTEVKKVLKDLK